MLLAGGADPNGVNKDGDTPLHWAARGGHANPVLSLSRHESFGLLANVGYTDAIQPTLTMLAPPERESAQGQSLGGAERCLGLPAMLETLLNLSP